MKKIFFSLSSFFGIFVFAQNVLAECTLNGEVIPCEDVPKWLFVFPFVFMGVFFIFLFLGVALWIWMLVDAIKNEKDNDLIVWVLVLVFLQIFGAIIYYFVRKRPRNKVENNALEMNAQSQKEEKINDQSKLKN
ncbi:MAG: hypothetical protein CR972_03680 [Candidatus Moraniibacteriota bacterium]|nr:MAG: hypothetical protein CR972_03680 [Candidatus Moranbacteria bacterium]